MEADVYQIERIKVFLKKYSSRSNRKGKITSKYWDFKSFSWRNIFNSIPKRVQFQSFHDCWNKWDFLAFSEFFIAEATRKVIAWCIMVILGKLNHIETYVGSKHLVRRHFCINKHLRKSTAIIRFIQIYLRQVSTIENATSNYLSWDLKELFSLKILLQINLDFQC